MMFLLDRNIMSVLLCSLKPKKTRLHLTMHRAIGLSCYNGLKPRPHWRAIAFPEINGDYSHQCGQFSDNSRRFQRFLSILLSFRPS